jgi:glycosyltransferase involved in cell wall biosynthesis
MSLEAATFSVIVVTRDNLPHTVRCMEALRRNSPDRTQLIVVDNGSTDGTQAYLTHLARQVGAAMVPVFLDHNAGWCGGVNLGLGHARGQYLVLLNNDVIVTPDWLGGLRACMDEAASRVPGIRRVGMVGPMTNAAGGPQLLTAAGAYDPATTLDAFACRHRAACAKQWTASFFLSGFCLMLSRACLDKVGNLDERFSPGGFDDNDLVLRGQEQGFEAVVAGDVFVHHEGGATFRVAHPDKQMGLANRHLFLQKWRERNAGPKRLVATYRVKNAQATLAESLEATSRFADEIVILDDGSTDGTRAICERAAKVSRYEHTSLPFDERRDRNHVLQMAVDQGADWIISVDADEIFEMDRARAQRLMHLADPHAKVLGFHWYTFWEPSRTYFRADGIFGNMSGFRMYKVEPGQRIVGGTENGLHCGNIPPMPTGQARYTNVRVRHLGYESEQLRQDKLAFYREVDKNPAIELVGTADYSHLVSSTVTLRRYAPATGLSLCMIVKNEEARLEEFLAGIEPFVDEICIVDNGSTDRSAQIARLFTDRIERVETPELDLADLRNRALALASRPFVLSMDPDEEIALQDLPRLARLIDDVDASAFSFQVMNHQKDGPPVMTLAVRLFRNDVRIRFSRPVHETVEDSLRTHPDLVMRHSDIVIQHYGYLKADDDVEGKIARYFERNRRYREEHPGDAMAWYNEALHLLNEDKEEEAVTFLVRAMNLDPKFLSPRNQLAYIFQERALRLWHSLQNSAPPDHPIQSTAQGSIELLAQITPPRPYVGEARRKRQAP